MIITKQKANLLEGLGLILLLISFFVQMEEINIESEIRKHQIYQIHKKLDYIWSITSQDYSEKHPEEGIQSSLNFKSYFDNYQIYSEDFKELNEWQELVNYDWFGNTQLALFIIGSVLIIIPKFTRLKE